MKTYNEVLMEINTIREAQKQNNAEIEELSNQFRKTPSMNIKEYYEYYEAHKEEIKERDIQLGKLGSKAEELKISLAILDNNAKLALFNDIAPMILKTLNKYNGKSLGEKTEKKIREQLLEETNCWVFIHTNDIKIQKRTESGYGNHEVIIGTKYIDGNRKPILKNNKIQPVTMEDLEVYYIKPTFVDDVKSETAFIKELHDKYFEAMEKCNEIAEAFNNHAPEGIPHINIIYGVYKNIFRG